MTIIKKLFLMTALALGLGAQLSASQPEDTNLLNFADSLQRIDKAEPKTIAEWIRSKYSSDKEMTTKLVNITNSEKTLKQKTDDIKELWQKETTPKINESYFSSMSNMAKAAVALVVTASIASYFYFMRPWTKATAE